MSELVEKIDNPKVINGLLKQAIFLRIPFHVKNDESNFQCSIKEILEADVRDANVERTLVFFLDTDSTLDKGRINLQEKVVFQFGLPNANIRFFSNINILTNHSITATFPKEIELIQLRVSKRLKIETDFHPVLYIDEVNQYEVALQIIDIDSNGIGANIKSQHVNFLPKINSIISGVLQINNCNFKFEKRITSSAKNNDGSFRVGLSQVNVTEKFLGEVQSRSRRFSVRSTLDIQSPLTGKIYTVNLTDLSMGGFKGSVEDALGSEPMIVGLDYNVVARGLRFNLLRHEAKSVSLKLIDGSPSDLVWWAKFVSKFTDSDIFTEVGRGEDLIRLFCESGAMASETLSRTSLYNNGFLDELAKDTKDDFWTFRWVNSVDADIIQGHVSAVRFSDSSWFIGDGAGGGSKESKVNRTFIPRFFDAFMDFCRSVNPLPKVFFIWKKDHPYWARFEEYLLSNQDKESFLGYYLIHFTKLDPVENLNVPKDAIFHEIKSNDIVKIRFIRQLLIEKKLEYLLDSFDFHESSFASARLLDNFRSANRSSFLRKYFELEYQGTKVLCIYTKLPQGTSLNQVMTSCFAIVLNENTNTSEHWGAISKLIHAYGTRYGVSPSSIRRIECYKSDIKIFNGEQGTSVGFLVYPELLNFFRPIAEGKIL